jgi:Rieske Fe-S protein
VIVASHVPIHTRVLLHTKIAAYRTYVLGVRTRAAMPDVLAWDDEDPYHYVRWAHIDGDPALLIGGEDHRTGADEHESVHFDRLQSWATERLGPLEPLRRWSGQIIEPVDGLPYVGVSSFSKHVFVATGYRGNGMTLGTASARALCDAIVGRENELASVFDATRITPLASAADFTASTIQAARHFIGDRLRTERTHPGRLKPGEGGIYLHRGSKYAISITEDGSVHCLSATCPHLGCVVAWNDAERTWDCPCHGSRFDPTGRVLNGPAIEGLKVDHSPLSGETHAT